MIQFAWGIPSKESVGEIRTAGAKMGIQIASAEGAQRALDLGADYLICQGTEVGLQATTSLEETLPRVIEAAHLTPVLAAGGIADGRAIRRVLVAGASGVLIGTRFVATQEADAHSDYKKRLIRANAGGHGLHGLLSGWMAERAASCVAQPHVCDVGSGGLPAARKTSG